MTVRSVRAESRTGPPSTAAVPEKQDRGVRYLIRRMIKSLLSNYGIVPLKGPQETYINTSGSTLFLRPAQLSSLC